MVGGHDRGTMPQEDERLQPLATSIRSRGTALDALAQQLRTPAILEAFDKWNHNSWCTAVAGDSLVRLRLLTEQNFLVLETMGVVAVARYVFEVTIWLRLFALDRRYGLVYFDQLLATQQRFYEDTLAQLERESEWLKSLDEKETASSQQAINEIGSGTPKDDQAKRLAAALSAVSADIDAEASRRFSLYAEAARTNGYGFQAYLVETKALPPVRTALDAIATERETFDSMVTEETRALRPSRWQWRPMAQKVGRVDEYDYLYSFASKLLHATPASITTDHKNLDAAEMEMFLKYIDVALDDILALAAQYHPASGQIRSHDLGS